MLTRLLAAIFAASFTPFVLAAETVRPAFTPPPAATVSSGSVLQVVLSLLLVLAAVVMVAWVLKRINLPKQGSGNTLKVISGVAVGQRERVVLVEVNDTWLVVGVAPGQVNALHTMPKGVLPFASNTSTGDNNKFQGWLKQMMEKRDAH
jgi:flagellar protein FliO/FliZ